MRKNFPLLRPHELLAVSRNPCYPLRMPTLAFLAATLLSAHAHAADPELTREPESPGPNQQYRLLFTDPGSACTTWKSVKPKLQPSELIVTTTQRAFQSGCRWIWVVAPGGTAPKALPEIEREDLAGAKSSWARPPTTLKESVERYPEKYKHEKPCPTWNATQYDCQQKDSAKKVTLVIDLVLDESSGDYILQPSEYGKAVAAEGFAGAQKVKVGGLSDVTPQSKDGEREPNEHLFRCQGGSMFYHRFTWGKERIREYKFKDDQIIISGGVGFQFQCADEKNRDTCSAGKDAPDFTCTKKGAAK